MKHLKKFNESTLQENLRKLEELKEFCNSNLAFLIDAGLKVEVFDYSDNRITIVISKTTDKREKNKLYIWDDVKYDFIPFIELLSSKLHYYVTVIFSTTTGNYKIPIEDIIEEDKFGNLTHLINIKYIAIEL